MSCLEAICRRRCPRRDSPVCGKACAVDLKDPVALSSERAVTSESMAGGPGQALKQAFLRKSLTEILDFLFAKS